MGYDNYEAHQARDRAVQDARWDLYPDSCMEQDAREQIIATIHRVTCVSSPWLFWLPLLADLAITPMDLITVRQVEGVSPDPRIGTWQAHVPIGQRFVGCAFFTDWLDPAGTSLRDLTDAALLFDLRTLAGPDLCGHAYRAVQRHLFPTAENPYVYTFLRAYSTGTVRCTVEARGAGPEVQRLRPASIVRPFGLFAPAPK